MMTIKEAEKITGITSQNIRYYEKQGLLAPRRKEGNDYREYSDEDILRLKQIKLFRKLDMPVGEIRRLLEGEFSLEDAVMKQISRLESEKDRLTSALEFCIRIQETQLQDMDVDSYLSKMEEKEREGSVFARLAEDYMAVEKAEMVREFSFMPYCRCDRPEEFTEELLKYGEQNGCKIVITREGMAPRFMMDGIEYKVHRTSSRFGIVLHCEMLHPEDYLPDGMTEETYGKYRRLTNWAIPILIILIAVIVNTVRYGFQTEDLIFLIPMVTLTIADVCFLYYCYGKNFKG